MNSLINVIDGTKYKKSDSFISSCFVYNIVKETDVFEIGTIGLAACTESDDLFS